MTTKDLSYQEKLALYDRVEAQINAAGSWRPEPNGKVENAIQTPEQLLGKYVYFVRRPGHEDGLVSGGLVTEISADRRLIVQVNGQPRIWSVTQVTTDHRLA